MTVEPPEELTLLQVGAIPSRLRRAGGAWFVALVDHFGERG